MRESQIEAYLRRRVKERGGLCWKFTSPNLRGVPDRLVVWEGFVFFVELKAPGGRPRASQVRRMAELEKAGADVWVLDSAEAVDRFIERAL